MMTEEDIEEYQTRQETALLNVERRVATAFGIKDVVLLGTHQLHCALIDKREAWYNDGGQRADDRFEVRLLALHKQFGSQTPFHSAFDEAFRSTLQQLPLREVESYLHELFNGHPELTDRIGYGYLADILRDTEIPSVASTRRALLLLDRKKSTSARKTKIIQEQSAQTDSNEYPCLASLTLAVADEIATTIGLIESGRYALGPKKKCGLIAFHQALKAQGLVAGNIEFLNQFFGNRYEVQINTRLYLGKKTADFYSARTTAELKRRRLRKADNDK